MNSPETLQPGRSEQQVGPRNSPLIKPILPPVVGELPIDNRTEELVDAVITSMFGNSSGPRIRFGERGHTQARPDDRSAAVSTISREDLVKRSIRVDSGEWDRIKRDKLRNWTVDAERESPNVGSGMLKKVDYVDLRKLKPGTIIGWQGRSPNTYYSVKKVSDEMVKVWRAGIPSGFVGRLEDISVWNYALGNNGSNQLDIYSGIVIEREFLGINTFISMPYFPKIEGGRLLPPNDYWVDIVKNLRTKEPR